MAPLCSALLWLAPGLSLGQGPGPELVIARIFQHSIHHLAQAFASLPSAERSGGEMSDQKLPSQLGLRP